MRLVGRAAICWNPPAIEPRVPGFGGVESHIVEGQAIGRRRRVYDVRGVKDELPLPLPEEQPDGEIDCHERRHHHQADADEDPMVRHQGIARAQGIVEVPGGRWTGGCRHDQPNPSSSADSSGVPQTRQMTAEQSPQVRGSLTGRAHVGHQSVAARDLRIWMVSLRACVYSVAAAARDLPLAEPVHCFRARSREWVSG